MIDQELSMSGVWCLVRGPFIISRTFHKSHNLRNRIDLSKFPQKFKEVHQNEKYVIVNKAPGFNCQDLDSGKKTQRTSERMGLFSILKSLDPEMRNIHRLDKWVSGGIIIARDKITSQRFSRQLQKGGQHGYGFKRRYVAVIKNGELPDANENLTYCDSKLTAGIIKTETEKGESITKFVLPPADKKDDFRLIVLQLETGRKHQIRQHLSEVLKKPISGDIRYGYEGILAKDKSIGLHSAFVQTQIGLTKEEFIIPVKYDPLNFWSKFIDEEGNFSEEIKEILVNFEEILDTKGT